jgi:N-acetylated-alpha-linked acidic dipeptidase
MTFRPPEHLLGFSPPAARRQMSLEAEIMAGLTPSQFDRNLRSILRWHREPGMPGDRQAAEYIAQRLSDLGLDAEISTYQQFLRYPGHIHLEMVAPHPHNFGFEEIPASRYPDGMPGGFIAYAGSGTIQAPVAYASYCSLLDLEQMRAAGVDPRGKILLIRFGQASDSHQTATKHQMEIAEAAGASGCIFYPDPAGDGFCRGAVYPDGPWRNATSVFRSNGKLGRPGDVLSPGWASVQGAPRIAESAAVLPQLPAASIAYGEALHILENLDGPLAPARMQGGMSIPYRLGGTSPVVHLDVQMHGRDYPIYDVVLTIPGADLADQCVYLGTHHDSWDGGAHDNAGGPAALLTVAESLAPHLKAGYRPRRTLKLISFDAEEVCYGGSTEYVEEHLEDLRRAAVAFLYVDGFSSGSGWQESFGPSLITFYEEVLSSLRDPILDESMAEALVQRHGPIPWDPPGTVDCLPFYHMAGVPSAYHAFAGANGVTHSVHDTIEYVLQQDPWHRFSIATTQIWLCAGLRLANAELLPFDYRRYAMDYRQRLTTLLAKCSDPAVIEEGGRLAATLARYALGTEAASAITADFSAGRIVLSPEKLKLLSDLVIMMERDLMTPQGPQATPWYTHTYASPACSASGYELATFPELTHALRSDNVERARVALEELQQVFAGAARTQETFATGAA